MISVTGLFRGLRETQPQSGRLYSSGDITHITCSHSLGLDAETLSHVINLYLPWFSAWTDEFMEIAGGDCDERISKIKHVVEDLGWLVQELVVPSSITRYVALSHMFRPIEISRIVSSSKSGFQEVARAHFGYS